MNHIRVGAGTFDIASATYLILDHPIKITGSGRGTTIFTNSLATATSDCIFRCTDKVHLSDFTVDRGSLVSDGIKLVSGALMSTLERVDFLFGGGAQAGRAIYIDSCTGTHLKDIMVRGSTAGGTVGIYAGTAGGKVIIEDCYFHECASGIQITVGTINRWHIKRCDFVECTTGINMDDGDYFTFEDCNLIGCTMGLDAESTCVYNKYLRLRFAGCTTNLDDDSTTSIWLDPCGCFPIDTFPADLVGVTVADGAANVYGSDTELLATTDNVKPFQIVGFSIHAEDAGHHSVRFSADSGTTFFAELIIDAGEGTGLIVGHSDIGDLERVFPRTTRISASWKSTDGNSDVNKIWVIRKRLM